MMKVYGVEITEEQIAAGVAAMTGTFSAHTVSRALSLAGVKSPSSISYVVERTADRLLQRERKAGRIRAINNRTWERVA